VAIQIDAREGMSMYPRLLPDGTVRYVEVAGRHLVLRASQQCLSGRGRAHPAGKEGARLSDWPAFAGLKPSSLPLPQDSVQNLN
jgi:hypothetical protein